MTAQEKALWHAVKRLQARLKIESGGFAPSVHATNHESGSTDPIDITTLDGFPNNSPATLFLREDGTFAAPGLSGEAVLMFVISGAGAVIPTGIVEGHLYVPIACEIIEAIALADQTGSIAVDIWKDTYANYPPDNADSITASAPVTISSALKSADSTLTGWTTSLAAGSILRFNVDSVTAIESLTIFLRVTV